MVLLIAADANHHHHLNNGTHFDTYDGNFDHAKILSAKLRQRLMTRVADNVHAANLLAQALEIVETLKHSSAANSINNVLDNLRRLSNAGKEHVDENGANGENGDAHDVSDSNTEQGVLKLVQDLSAQLKDTLEMSSQQLTRFLPQPVTERIVQASKIASDIYLQVSQVCCMILHTDEKSRMNQWPAEERSWLRHGKTLLNHTFQKTLLVMDFRESGDSFVRFLQFSMSCFV